MKRSIFISYAKPDEQWAEWIAWQLEDSGHEAFLMAWDFQPGENFVEKIHAALQRCSHIIALLSPRYLKSKFCQEECTAAFVKCMKQKHARFLPIMIAACEPVGLYAAQQYLNLVGMKDQMSARRRLLSAVDGVRSKPGLPPAFPPRAMPPPFPHSPTVIGTPPRRSSSRKSSRNARGIPRRGRPNRALEEFVAQYEPIVQRFLALRFVLQKLTMDPALSPQTPPAVQHNLDRFAEQLGHWRDALARHFKYKPAAPESRSRKGQEPCAQCEHYYALDASDSYTLEQQLGTTEETVRHYLADHTTFSPLHAELHRTFREQYSNIVRDALWPYVINRMSLSRLAGEAVAVAGEAEAIRRLILDSPRGRHYQQRIYSNA